MKNFLIIVLVVLILLILVSSIIFVLDKNNDLTPNEDGHIITCFSLSESSSNDMAVGGAKEGYYFSLYKNSLEIETTELEEKIIVELNKTERENIEQELLRLIKTYSLKKWDGYDEWMDVLDDSHSFKLSVEYANEKEINAYGDHMFPNNYDDVFEAVQYVFLNYENNE